MITRIARMHFTESGVDEFLRIFNTNRNAIKSFKGCTHLQLLKDLGNDVVFTTVSHWNDMESLERYRESELFSSVWGRVKKLFAERPQAYSMVAVDDDM